jgi:hypothetical protein
MFAASGRHVKADRRADRRTGVAGAWGAAAPVPHAPASVHCRRMQHDLGIRVAGGIGEVPADAWDACANPPGQPRNPFVQHAFLRALEDSGSAVTATGWRPVHVLLEHRAGGLQGAVPMYLKSHSRGEYVFDAGWADAYARAGGRYYPKLQVAVPFTPVTGPRLLVRGGHAAAEGMLARACLDIAARSGVSSLHFTFLPRAQCDLLAGLGCEQRVDQQFHWHNHGYGSFDDFLGELAAKKRKNLKRERRDALAGAGIRVEWVTGSDLREAHWDAFYAFYTDTGNRKWGHPYLTRSFFSMVGQAMPVQVLLVLCRRGDRYIAGALNFIGSDTLYGRNWGCIEDHRFLHFETCYYQAIEFAIAHRLARVEAGAQGAHKVARGYLPQRTWSAHWLADAGLREAVARYLREERAQVAADIEWVEAQAPFRSDVDLDALRVPAPPAVDDGPAPR